jgi:UDP-N-acetylmuramoyl-tripeptide--D-alanyl-D-alanine ligase
MKRIKLTIEDFFNLPTAVLYGFERFKNVYNVSIDSRSVKRDSLFVAIKGEKFDGHNFVSDAVKNGAIAVAINEETLSHFDTINVPIITVKDTTIALGYIAKVWRRKLSARVIGITGSAGKTTTKEILAAILISKFRVNKTLANNNNHIGVPLTILNTNEKHQVLIAELGTNHFGEIEYSANILQPDYALITNIGDSHLEFLKDRKRVYKEKSALYDITVSGNGLIFINSDDKYLKTSYLNYPQRVIYGFSGGYNISGKILDYDEVGKPIVEISYKQKKFKAILPAYGKQSANSFLAAVSVALKLGLSEKEIISGLWKFKSIDKRLNVRKFSNAILIDDTYNANPDSTKAAIELVSKIKSHKKKIVILGDMLELGDKEIQLHKNISKFLIRNNIDVVYTIGKLMGYLDDGLNNSDIIHRHFKNKNSLMKHLSGYNFEDSVVLVKGSRGMKMEEFVTVIETKLSK